MVDYSTIPINETRAWNTVTGLPADKDKAPNCG